MPESRDRLTRSRNSDTVTYVPRQITSGTITVRPDNDEDERGFGLTPFRWGSTPLTGEASDEGGSARGVTRGGVGGRGLFGSPVTGYRRGGRNENTPPVGSGGRRGRGGGRARQVSVLPAWYPRTPLRDITHVVRAIERRRAAMGDGDGQVFRSPIGRAAGHVPSPMGRQVDDKASLVTPKPNLESKALGKVPLILNDIANHEDSEDLTPQRKLLNSIEIVQAVVMEEINRLKRTPAAKKAEREKKVKILMSMR